MSLQPPVAPEECSPIYETPPWGYTDQPDFLNQVLRGHTDLQPQALLHHLKNIEAQMGRKSTLKYGPRIIDIDILFYDQLILDTEDLTIPHPHLDERAFILVPLTDLSPDLSHPVLNKTIQDLLEDLDASGVMWHAPGDCGRIKTT